MQKGILYHVFVAFALGWITPAAALDRMEYSRDPEWRKFELEWFGRPAEQMVIGRKAFLFLNKEKRNTYARKLFEVVSEMEVQPPAGFCVRGGGIVELQTGMNCRSKSTVCQSEQRECDRIFDGATASRQCVAETEGQTTRSCVQGVQSWTAVSNHLASRFSVVQWIQLGRGIHTYCRVQKASQACRNLGTLVSSIRLPGRLHAHLRPPITFRAERVARQWIKSFGAWPELLAYLVPKELFSTAYAQAADERPTKAAIEESKHYTCEIIDPKNKDAPPQKEGAKSVFGAGGARVYVLPDSISSSPSWSPDDAVEGEFLNEFASGKANAGKLKKAASKIISGNKEGDEAKKEIEERHKDLLKTLSALDSRDKRDEVDRELISGNAERELFQKHRGAMGILTDFQTMRSLAETSGLGAKETDLLLVRFYGKGIFALMDRVKKKSEAKNAMNSDGNSANNPVLQKQASEPEGERTDALRYIEKQEYISRRLVAEAQSAGASPADVHAVFAELDKALKGTKSAKEKIALLIGDDYKPEELKGRSGKLFAAFDGESKGRMRGLVRELIQNTIDMINDQDQQDGKIKTEVSQQAAAFGHKNNHGMALIDPMGKGDGFVKDLVTKCNEDKPVDNQPRVREPAEQAEGKFESPYNKNKGDGLGK